MSDTKFKKDDLVVIGRKKDQYRIKQISPSGEGAALVETIDAKPYASTYVNVDQLKPSKATKQAAPTPPATHQFYNVTLTSPAGAVELTIAANSDAEAVDLAKAQTAGYETADGVATKVTS